MKLPIIKDNNGTISTFCKGRDYIIGKDHKFYNECLEALKQSNAEEFVKFANLKDTIKSYVSNPNSDSSSDESCVTIVDDKICYKGTVLHNTVCDRILDFIKEGLDHTPLVKFIEKLMRNTSLRCVDNLYSFLESKCLPIDQDGDFLAYKRVRDDYKDFHTGKIDNIVGTTVEMPRNMVDDDFRNECSRGLHVGSREYVSNFHNDNGHVLLVKVNPEHVVSIPDYDRTKMRVCQYFIVEELDKTVFGIDKVYYDTSEKLNSYKQEDFDSYDEDEDDFDELDDSEEFNTSTLDFSEFIDEVCQGSLKEELISLISSNNLINELNYETAFLRMRNLATGSVRNLLNKTSVINTYNELFSTNI